MEQHGSRFGLGQRHQIVQYILNTCAIVLLLVTFLGNATVLARYEQRPISQQSPLSPLSPLATAVTTTLTLTTPTLVTVSTPVVEAVAPTVTLASTLTVTQSAAVVELVNRGQTSLLLVGAVFVGILLVTVLVIGRHR